MHILGIETSCDDTAVSVIKKSGKTLTSVSHIHFSQIRTHAKFGGVIPEVAAREHTVTIMPTITAALAKASITLRDIDLIAVTQGPGLPPALSVGIDTARIFSGYFEIPLLGVNHIEGHIASVWPIRGIGGASAVPPKLPALALVVSGGHTELHVVRAFGDYTLLGRTRDDAVGEAFDKVASLLRLPYPGGPAISALAQKGRRAAYALPRPMIADKNYDFSFSGLKTSVRYLVGSLRLSKKIVRDICASFEQAAVDVLVAKTIRALEATRARSVLVVGGVSANRYLRSTLKKRLANHRAQLFLAPKLLTQDNATMICMAASIKKTFGSARAWKTMRAKPRWELR